MSVALLEEEELLHTSIDVGADVVPGVGGVVLVGIRPGVTKVARKRGGS